ncbi:MAG: hypothetical protein NTV86_03965 [Planctomycetota bacterium]|nr:hypothetical protein [Planctomycetota bacterium]
MASMTSEDLVRQIGEPDQKLSSAEFVRALPGNWGSSELDYAIRSRIRRLSKAGQDSSTVAAEVNASGFWVYDESARYGAPSQPDSFWGMGTGFQVVWFAVYKDQVIASDGFGLGKSRRLTEH